MASVMARTEVEDMGGGPILIIPLETRTIRAPLFRVPAQERVWLMGLLRAAADGPTLDRLVRANLEVYSEATALGALRYPVDGVRAPADRQGWARHYGPVWQRAVRLKKRLDPDGLFSPGLGIFEG